MPGVVTQSDTPALSATSDASARWSAALQALLAVVECHRLYGVNHAAAQRALAAAGHAFSAIAPDEFPAKILVNPDALHINAQPLTGRPGLDLLHEILYAADVAILEWLAVPTPDQITATAAWLIKLGPGTSAGRPRQPEACDSCLRVKTVGDSGLRFQAGAEALSWDQLLSSVERSASDSERAVGTALRAAVQASSHEDLARSSQVLHHGADGRSDAAHRAALLKSINPQLRSALLSLGAAAGASWLSDDLAAALPVDELAGAIKSVQSSGASVPPATLMMLRRLIGMTSLSGTARDELRSVLDPAHSVGLDHRLADIFADRGSQEFFEADYDQQLQGAARVQPPQPGTHRLPFGDIDPAALTTRSAEVALLLIEAHHRPEDDPAELLASLDRRIKSVVASKRIDLLLSVLRAVDRFSGASESAASAAAELRRSLDTPPIRDLILAQLDSDGFAAPQFATLLSVYPGPVLARSFQRLQAAAPDAAARDARFLAELVNPRDLAPALAAAIADHRSLQGMFRLLQQLAPDKLAACITPLLDADPKICSAALRLAESRLPDWPVGLLQRAVRVVDSGTEWIVARRVARSNALVPEALIEIIRSRPLRSPLSPLHAACITALVERGVEGRAAAIHLLGNTPAGSVRCRFSLTAAIAEALARFPDDPAAAAAVSQWRRSPSGLFAAAMRSVGGKAA